MISFANQHARFVPLKADTTDRRAAVLRTIVRMSALSELTGGPFSDPHRGPAVVVDTLLSVWKDGAFDVDYRRCHQDIVRRTAPTPSPNHFVSGVADALDRAGESEPTGGV